ncbi:CBL-interacting serine/threonine-protein kinase 4 [Linum grandiflorum]
MSHLPTARPGSENKNEHRNSNEPLLVFEQVPDVFSEEHPEESDYYSKFNSLTSTFNAFDIISMSSGLDLSGLFETGLKKEKRFTSTERLVRVMEKVKEVGKKLDYRVEEGKGGGAIGLEKGRVVFRFEAMEIAEKMVVAEVMIIGKGCGMEFEDVH